MRQVKKTILATGLLSLVGCASILSDSRYPVSVTSSPSHAEFKIVNQDGRTVHAGRTPATVTLKGGAGFFDGETYKITFEKEGFDPMIATLDSEVDGWYVANILFGGILGLLIIDPMTGAMWTLDDEVNVSITQNQASSFSESRSLIVARDSLPGPIQDNLIPLPSSNNQ